MGKLGAQGILQGGGPSWWVGGGLLPARCLRGTQQIPILGVNPGGAE